LKDTEKILIVDADASALQSTRDVLNMAGYPTLGAHNAGEALQVIRTEKPALVLMEAVLPDMAGFEVCRRVRSEPDLAGVYMILLYEKEPVKFEDCADCLIVRPVSNHELLARVRGMLRLRSSERALQISTGQWEATFNSVVNVIFLTDADFNILKCNSGAERLFERSIESMLGKKCYRVVEGTDQPAPDSPILAMREGKQRATRIFKRGDRWLEVTVDPVLDPLGNFSGSVHVIADITERKQAEEALLETSAHLTSMIANSSTVIYALKVAGDQAVLSWISANIEAVLGFSVEEAWQPGWWLDHIHPQDLALVRDSLEHLFDDLYQHEYRFLCKDGRRVWLHDEHRLVRDANNKPAEIIGTWKDITELKLVEEELRVSEDKFKYVFDHSVVGKSLTRPLSGEIDVNQSFCDMLGYSREELKSRKWQEITHPDDLELTQNFVNALISGQRESARFVKRFIHKDGSTVWADLSTALRRDEDGQPLYFMSSVIDITERKLAEEKIIQLNTELEQRVEERTLALNQAQEQLVVQERLAVLGQLAGSVGHELRNPLGVISNAIYFLKLVHPEADEKTRQYFDMIEQETRTSEKIITDLLDFARIKKVERVQAVVPDLLQRVLVRFPVPGNIQVALQLPDDLPFVLVDPRQAEQILGNLVTNACQAMPDGGNLVISARPSIAAGRSSLAISVKDSGVGISPENMPKLFEPLFTTKPSGIGLGLAVCKRLAEANGGRIEVQSEPGIGSTFTLHLPTDQESI
jgi:PAS domain S-box-containing protein